MYYNLLDEGWAENDIVDDYNNYYACYEAEIEETQQTAWIEDLDTAAEEPDQTSAETNDDAAAWFASSYLMSGSHLGEGDYDEREEHTTQIDAPRRHSLDPSILFEGKHSAAFIAEPHEQESDDDSPLFSEWVPNPNFDSEWNPIPDLDFCDA